MPLIDCFYKSKINYYLNTHEQSGGHAATGYAKTTGKPGISIVTSGPGITNSITPLTDATNDSTPLMVISGQVNTNVMGTLAFQECPAIEITKPVTKYSYCIKNIEEVPYIMDKAYKIANDGKKGAVHIDLPKNIFHIRYIVYFILTWIFYFYSFILSWSISIFYSFILSWSILFILFLILS